jgi:excisionase family DNA binding protein
LPMASDSANPYFLYTSPEVAGGYLARATDGTLYLVPDIAGGWAERVQHRARVPLVGVADVNRIVSELGGDNGGVQIAALSDDLIFPVAEAAAATGIPHTTIQNACQRGRIPGAKPFGREWAVPTRGLREYLASGYHPRPTRRGRPQPRRAASSAEKG